MKIPQPIELTELAAGQISNKPQPPFKGIENGKWNRIISSWSSTEILFDRQIKLHYFVPVTSFRSLDSSVTNFPNIAQGQGWFTVLEKIAVSRLENN